MSFVRSLIEDTSIPWDERRQAIDRIYSTPGIPVQHSTPSFWLKQPREFFELSCNSFPHEADIVIIGTGITGTSVAYTLLQSDHGRDNGPKIVMVESRDVCSGATGRNGGHCIETAEEYLALRDDFGVESAAKIMEFRLSHLSVFLDAASELGIIEEAQVRKVQFISPHFDRQSWKAARSSVDAFKRDMPELGKDFEMTEAAQDIATLGVRDAFGVVTGPAGAIWPYKFVTNILDNLVKKYSQRLSISTNTSVNSIQETDRGYLLNTSRGLLNCKNIVHCTNGHVAHLLPELLGNIYPIRGQMSAQAPLRGRSNQAYKHSWLLNYEKGYDYLTQLPDVDGVSNGEMMLGGGFASLTRSRLREIGVANDDVIDPDIKDHLEHVLEKVLVHEENEGQGCLSRVKSMWTGIMGFSSDGMPWVGQLPQKQPCPRRGQWIAAGFSGEGMVHAWLCGKAVAEMVLGYDQGMLQEVTQEVCQWLPEQYLISSERIQATKMPESVSERSEEVRDYSIGVAGEHTAARL